jgi:hypothetical protein
MGGSPNSQKLELRAHAARSVILPESIYFAHPINYYIGFKFNVHGNREKELISIIEKRFPRYNVFNPNRGFNRDNYLLWKEETGNGMNYYFDVILPEMVAGVGLTFEDGMFGAGVYEEIEKFFLYLRPAFEIDNSGVIVPIRCFGEFRKLTAEKTKERVYGRDDGKE